MDAARRWQVASTATAVAGLSIGALLLGRPTSQPVETIDLDQLTTVENRTDTPTIDDPPTPRGSEPEIVRPRVIEDAPSRSSESSVSRESEAGSSSGTPSSKPRSDPPDSPDSPNSPDSPDSPSSPESVDSPSSVDSD